MADTEDPQAAARETASQWDWRQPDDPPFVGRDTELRTTDAAWLAAARGHGRAVLVLGEAGAGKSRLVAEAAWRAAGDGTQMEKYIQVGWRAFGFKKRAFG